MPVPTAEVVTSIIALKTNTVLLFAYFFAIFLLKEKLKVDETFFSQLTMLLLSLLWSELTQNLAASL